MNIVREERPNQVEIIKVTVGEGDYAEQVDKTLKDYRRKANVPGFRPGMVPMGIVNKMYRKGVIAEETYRVASKACFDHLEAEKIEYLGDVIPSDEQGEFDFDNDKEHEFIFEIGLAPKVELELTSKDKIEKYGVKTDEAMYKNYRDNFMRRYGRLVDADEATSDEALTVTLDNEHMNVADAYVGLISMSEEERKPFIGKKVGDVMQVNVNELYTNTAQRAAILKVKEDELDTIDPNFTLTIEKIRKFAEPELNEEFYKMAFPDGQVTDEKGLEKFIRDQIEADLSRETGYVFNYAVRKMLMDKADLPMPEEFLKRWLFTINEGKFPMEQIEKDFPQFLEMMRWNLIQKFFAGKFNLEITPEEATEEAKNMARQQFAQYGMTQIADDMLENYSMQILQNKDEARKIYDRLYEKKVIEAVVPLITVKEKNVTAEEFGKYAEELQSR